MYFALSQEVCTCHLDTTFTTVRVNRVLLHRQKMVNLIYIEDTGISHTKAPNCFFTLLETCVVSSKVCQTNINSYFN